MSVPGSFVSDLQSLINRHSMENDSDTPDFILAQYLKDSLCAWQSAICAREKWYGRQIPGSRSGPTPVLPPDAPELQVKQWGAVLCSCAQGPHTEMIPDPDGGYVRVEDYVDVVKKLAALRPQGSNPPAPGV